MAAQSMSGIYEIVNLVNGKRYVGSAVDFKNRWTYHRRDLRGGRHHSRYLQAAWNKHGEENFSFRVLEYVADVQLLVPREQFHIDECRPEYNLCRTAGSCLGHRWTDEQKAKKSLQMIGKRQQPIGFRHSEETKRKISERNRLNPTFFGHTHSPETRAKLSAQKAGKKCGPMNLSDQERKRRAESAAINFAGNNFWLGRKHSEESRRKIAASKENISDETRRRMAEAQRRRPPTKPETRAKMSARHQGHGNSAAIKEVFSLRHRDGSMVAGTPIELRQKTGISPAGMSQLIRGKQEQANGWRVISHPE